MEVVAAAPAFDALAFAFAAFAFALIAGALLINPLNTLAGAASGIPVVGGALSWAFSFLADLVIAAVDGVEQQKANAYNQATAWWNWIVTTTIWNYYGNINGNFAWVFARIGDLWNQSFGAIPSAIANIYGWINSLSSSINGLAAWESYVAAQTIPNIYSWIDYLNRTTSALSNDVYNIDTHAIPTLDALIRSLQADMTGVLRWEDVIGGQVLPRLEADVNLRAYESEAEALRRAMVQAQYALNILWPLALIAVAGAEAISNLRCQMDTPCDPLAQLAGGDVIDRLNHLEISEG